LTKGERIKKKVDDWVRPRSDLMEVVRKWVYPKPDIAKTVREWCS